jgi:iron complex outermembrane recepter protein
MKTVLKSISGAAVIALAASLAMPAFAQDASEDAEENFEDEIIVTATKREQVAQDVPLAVSVVGAQQLANAGVVDIRGIQQIAPSLKTTTGQSSATGAVLNIRGVGTAGDNPGFEPAVGVFVDGVFRARAGVALSELPPIDRVEVLRGPQGTLFGRNTSAGALSITTAKPKFELGGYAELSYGNYDELEVKAGITGPVSEKVALRADGGYHKRDGYIRDVNGGGDINNIDRYFVRGQALFDSENINLRIIADYAKTDEACCGAVNSLSGTALAPLAQLAGITNPALTAAQVTNLRNFAVNFNPALASYTNAELASVGTNAAVGAIATGALNPLAGNALVGGAAGRIGVPAYTRGSRLMAVTPGRDLSEKVREWGVSAELNWDFGDVSLASITAYRDWDARRNQDVDFSGLDRAYRDNYRTGITDFTQELRLQGTAMDDKLDWLVGAFYLNEKLTLNDTIRFGTQSSVFVDTIIRGLTTNASLPSGLQLHGTQGPAVPLFGQVALATNPTLLAAALGNPALFALFNSPIPGNPAGSGQQNDAYRVKTNAIAIFTHNIINFSDNLSLTLGLRYNHEKKKIDTDLNATSPTCAFFQNPATAPYRTALQGAGLLGGAFLLGCNPVINTEFNGIRSDKRSENEFTGTAKLAYKVNDDILIYGGYDRGYKSGGYNLDRGSFDSIILGGNGPQLTDLEFGNETVDAFEIGVKTNFTRAFQFNASLFHQDFKGYQNNRFLGNNFVVLNFAKFVSKGLELESIIRPAQNLIFNLGYTFIDSKTTDPRAGTDNNRQGSNTPKHTVTGAMTFTPRVSDTVQGLLHMDFRYQSDAFPLNDPIARPFTGNDGFAIVNLRAGLNFGDGKYSIEGYVENLFDTYFNITSFPIPEQGLSFANYPAPPRFYGVKVGAKF